MIALLQLVICGINKIYKIGGSAAVAAFAYGTKTIKKVNKIVGPGNNYVALAKKQLFGSVGIDMIAGPTDVLVICDNKAKPSWIAADLLSQLEHGVDSKAILITDDIEFAQKVNENINFLKEKLPRKGIIDESLTNSYIIIVKNLEKDAAPIANNIAPEHLEIVTKNPKKIAQKLLMLAQYFLENIRQKLLVTISLGPSHTLPTMSSAKFSSGLSVFDFLKEYQLFHAIKNLLISYQKQLQFLLKQKVFTLIA